MSFFAPILIYGFLFFLVYYQVFILLTFFEHRKNINSESARNLNNPHGNLTGQFPSVTILVPVFNEEKTVEKTIQSLLNLNYPPEKLKITIVDDGSTDETWQLVQKFAGHPQITTHTKSNGGKYTALNYGLEHCETELVGCLDADSEVDSEALRHIIPYFLDDQSVMAVTPSMKIRNSDTILGLMQNAEYSMGIFLRKIMGLIDAQYVTPGPFSIFRRRVFETVGKYRHAHNTEDLEMALRLQNHHMKISCAHRAIVYTVGPRNLYRLYRQRVRWTGGFIQNALDYKHMILNPKYGNLGMLILPVAMWSIVGTMTALLYTVFEIISKVVLFVSESNTIGWNLSLSGFSFNFSVFREWIYYHTQTTLILSLFSFGLITFAVWYGKKLANVQDSKKMDIVYFIVVYSLIAPLWLATSVYNTIRRRDAAWR